MILPWEQSWNTEIILTFWQKEFYIYIFSCYERRGFKEGGNLDTTKLSEDTDIPTKIIKQNTNILASFICKSFKNMVDSSTFPAALKLAHITTVFKKGSKNSKEKTC